MAVPQILLAIFFLISHVRPWPMALPQGCGISSMTCCLRRGATNLACEGQRASDYQSHSRNIDPYYTLGARVRNIDIPVAMNANSREHSLGLMRFTFSPDNNQFQTYFVPDNFGPTTAVIAQRLIDSRVHGIRFRWALFRAQAGSNEEDPHNWFIITPVQRGTTTHTDQAFAEVQLYGHITHTNYPNVFYNTIDVQSQNIHYRFEEFNLADIAPPNVGNFDSPIAVNVRSGGTFSLGLLRITFVPNNNQFLTSFIPSTVGPSEAIFRLHSQDNRVAGLRTRWALFRQPTQMDPQDPRSWFVVGPAAANSNEEVDPVYAEARFTGAPASFHASSHYYNPSAVRGGNLRFRFYFRTDLIDSNGNVIPRTG
ncbi:uncharacterized protein J3D65DRAFT_683866 [Phyllosticta citribraziliensis]|uniref:Uncharacterized protein n=1 Tax=Phyllosticta citribraziliensis TaxID=989973 RepID=A0ABR1MAY9_9PEZI